MNTVERIKAICKERKIPISRLEKDLGFGNAYISGLKKGTVPDDRLRAISKYLYLSTEYLMTGKDTHNTDTLSPKDDRDIKKDLDSIMQKLTNKEYGPAAYDGEDLSDESIELFRDELEIALKRLKLINKEKYNPKKSKK